MGERVVFGETFEALYHRALRGRLSPELIKQLRAAGIDVDRPFLAGYPLQVWMRGLDLLAPSLDPKLSFEEATWQIGEDFIFGFAQTVLGRAVFAVLRVVGPMRSLERMGRNFRNGNNYVTTRFTKLGPTAAEVWMNDVHGHPGFAGGAMRGGGKLVGAKNFTVQISATDGESCTYRITWDE